MKPYIVLFILLAFVLNIVQLQGLDLMDRKLLSRWTVQPKMFGTSKLTPSPGLELNNPGGKKKAFWRINLNEIKLGKCYILTGKVKVNTGTTYRVYVESGAKNVWENYGGFNIRKGNGSWQNIKLMFKFKKRPSVPWVVLQLTSKGNMEASDFQLVPYIEPLKKVGMLLKQGKSVQLITSEMHKKWKNNNQKTANYSWGVLNNESTLQLKQTGSTSTYWIVHNLPLEQGVTYALSCQVKGDKGAKFRIYMENQVDGKYANFGAKTQTIKSLLQTMTFSFAFKNVKNLPYLVLQLKDPGKIEFLKLTLTPQKKISNNWKCDFQKSTARWKMEKGAKRVFELEKGENKVLELSSLDGNIARAFSPPIQVIPSRVYQISYSVRGVKQGGNSHDDRFFRVYSAQNKAATDEWKDCWCSYQQKRVKFSTATNQKTLQLVAEFRSPGKLYIDNIVLELLNEKVGFASILLDAPFNQRNGILKSHKAKKISGQVIFKSPEVAFSILTYFNQNGKKVFEKRFSRNGSFQLSIPALSEKWNLSLTSFTASGAKLGNIIKKIRHYPSFPKEATFNSQGIMLVDGKRFFPIGHWETGGRGDLDFEMSFLKEAGFNTLLMTADRGILDLAQLHGLKIMKALPERITGKTTTEKQQTFKFFKQDLKRVSNHPALLGFFMSDEPLWRGVPYKTSKEVYDFVRQQLPNFPLWMNEAPRGTVADLQRYATLSDVYGVDIYPVPEGNSHSALADKGLSSVGKYTDICRKVVHYRKPVWMMLQSFSWNQCKKPSFPPGKSVYPTFKQSRFMAYNALTHGATGIFYHYLGYSKNISETFWKDLRKVLLELNYLAPVLASDTVSPSSLKCADHNIKILQKKYNDVDYFLVVNESKVSVDVLFSGLVRVEKLNTLLENVPVKLSNGSFRIRIPARGVKVWSQASFPSIKKLYKPSTYCPYNKINNYLTNILKGANWIWYPGKSLQKDSIAYFRRSFLINKKVSKATLYITADDYYKMYVNGKASGSDEPGSGTNFIWTRLKSFDLTKLLRKGGNVIAVKATDGGMAPCALLAILRVEYVDGSVQEIKSNTKWLANLKFMPDFFAMSCPDSAEWKAAEIVAPYGKGAWGNKIEYIIPGEKLQP